MIFLLAKEEQLKGYLNQQILRATIFWGIVQTLVLVLFVPLALALGLSLTIVVVYLAILFLLKVLVFQGRGKDSITRRVLIGSRS